MLCSISSGSTLFAKIKKRVFRNLNHLYLVILTYDPLIHAINYPRLIVLNQVEEFIISMERVNFIFLLTEMCLEIRLPYPLMNSLHFPMKRKFDITIIGLL